MHSTLYSVFLPPAVLTWSFCCCTRRPIVLNGLYATSAAVGCDQLLQSNDHCPVERKQEWWSHFTFFVVLICSHETLIRGQWMICWTKCCFLIFWIFCGIKPNSYIDYPMKWSEQPVAEYRRNGINCFDIHAIKGALIVGISAKLETVDFFVDHLGKMEN